MSVSYKKLFKLYKMGKPRAVPYKNCGSFYDEGWIDDICTERRGKRNRKNMEKC